MTDQLRNPSSSSSSTSSSPATSPSPPVLCVNSCGFFGSPKQDNLCSKCYKAVLSVKKESQTSPASSSSSSSSTPLPCSSSASSDLSIPPLVHCTERPTGISHPVELSEGIEEEENHSSSPSSSPPVLSFSESLHIPLTFPASSPTLSSTPSSSPLLPSSDVSPSSPSLSRPLCSLSLTSDLSFPSAPLLPSPSTSLPAPSSSSSPVKPKKNRCSYCNIKVGLTYFSCRCNEEGMFCASHRYPHSHQCTFDHKAQKQLQVAKNNPLCAHDKLERI